MTLQDLIDWLTMLPVSSRSAIVIVRHGDIDDFNIRSVCYEYGDVVIECENVEEDDAVRDTETDVRTDETNAVRRLGALRNAVDADNEKGD